MVDRATDLDGGIQAITVDDRGVGLEVRAPAEALSVVDALLGPRA